MAGDFDLLGDPIPENFGKRGRPPHLVTDENRCKVMMLLAMGWTKQRIANALNVTAKTLAKHYFRELSARDEARDRVEASMMVSLWKQVEAGNVAAIKELGRIIEKLDLARMAKGYQDVQDEDEKPVRKLGKKEQAQAAAETAGEDSDWGQDLLGSAGPRLN